MDSEEFGEGEDEVGAGYGEGALGWWLSVVEEGGEE